MTTNARNAIAQSLNTVKSPWSLSQSLSNHQKALLQWLIYVQTDFQFICYPLSMTANQSSLHM